MSEHEQGGPSQTRHTLRLNATDPGKREEAISRAGEILAQGGLVAFPTETVYGLGANALDPAAVRSIFDAKGRPGDNPLIVHVGRFDEARPLLRRIPEQAERLAEAFWPGPLTLVLPASGIVPEVVTAGLDTVGIRVPGHDVALELISRSGVPVAAPSANVSGSPSPTTAEHVLHDMDGRIDAILDGGPCRVGIESTVLDLSGEIPAILRLGGISPESLRALVPELKVPPAGETPPDIPKAPGMKYRHYAPSAKLLLVIGEPEKVAGVIEREIASWQARGHRVAVLATREHASRYRAPFVRVLGSRHDSDELARNLFAELRELDRSGADVILAEGFDGTGLGLAVMNRLRKASGGDIIHAR